MPLGLEMPTWKDLGRRLAADVSDYVWDGEAVDAISAYAHEHGRNRLLATIANHLYVREAEPGPAHEAFCRIDVDTVITTNFEFLLDDQYRKLNKPSLPIVEEQQLTITNPHIGPRLIKLHGDLHHPNEMTVTEEDYDGFLRQKPLMATALASILIERTGLLVGYSLGDPDVRQILNLLSERLGANRRPLYALLVNPTAVELARFRRRGITPVSIPLFRDHGHTLSALFADLQQTMEEEVARTGRGSTVESTVSLRLPRALSRLVYLSVPPRDAPFYRTHLFPRITEIGGVPITAEEISTDPGSEAARPAAALARAVAAMIDLRSDGGTYEYTLAEGR